MAFYLDRLSKMNLNYRLILASKSPRRQELLSKLDLSYDVRVKSIDESYPSHLPKNEVAEFLAIEKSKAFGDIEANELLITCDTTVVKGHALLEKASNSEEAISMLNTLSGTTHNVITGVCLRTQERTVSFAELTSVTFTELSQEEIFYYISSYKPFDKAGAYGIQEWIGMIGISKINGDFYNVMGLPLHRLYKTLQLFA